MDETSAFQSGADSRVRNPLWAIFHCGILTWFTFLAARLSPYKSWNPSRLTHSVHTHCSIHLRTSLSKNQAIWQKWIWHIFGPRKWMCNLIQLVLKIRKLVYFFHTALHIGGVVWLICFKKLVFLTGVSCSWFTICIQSLISVFSFICFNPFIQPLPDS